MASNGMYRRGNPSSYEYDTPQMTPEEINEAYRQRKSSLAANDEMASRRSAGTRQSSGNRTLVKCERQGSYGDNRYGQGSPGANRSARTGQQQLQYPRNRAQGQQSGSHQARSGARTQHRSASQGYGRDNRGYARVNPAGTGRTPAKRGFPISKRALIAAGVFIAIFAFILISVTAGMGWVVPFDEAIGGAVRSLRVGFLNPIMRAISFLGSTKVSIVFIALFCVFLFLKRERSGLIFFVIAIGVGLGAAWGCKYLVGRARPTGILLDGDLVETDPCFPSGHSVTALLLWGLIAVILYVYYTNRGEGGAIKALSKGFAIIWPLLMGLSRLYMGEHFATDVFGGWAFAAFVLVLAASFYLNRFLLDDDARERANPRYRQRSMDRIDYGR
ncbi:MAG: phosphatase PAP2 family protein [bacterium]|nr:phosphatase PAP2 family protein [bacterium]